MHEFKGPKVILNDDYVDLREKKEHTRSESERPKVTASTSKRVSSLHSEGDCNEKELINHGLKKLITTFNSQVPQAPTRMQNRVNLYSHNRFKNKEMVDTRFRRQRSPDKKSLLSQSESTLLTNKLPHNSSCSSPSIMSGRTDRPSETSIEKDFPESTAVDKSTMTDNDLFEGPNTSMFTINENNFRLMREPVSYFKNPDPRLVEKYPAVLCKPKFKRTWTVPYIGPNSDMVKYDGEHYAEDKASTYYYDDGSDIDSFVLLQMKKAASVTFIQKHGKTILVSIGTLCGIMLVSLIVWMILGTNTISTFLQLFLRRKQADEHIVKKALRTFGGGILYVVNTFFMTLFRIITIQTNEVLGTGEHTR